MSDKDTMHALERIGQALSRIEAIESAGGDPAATATLAALTDRHERLRGQVRATLARLDALIADRAEPHA